MTPSLEEIESGLGIGSFCGLAVLDRGAYKDVQQGHFEQGFDILVRECPKGKEDQHGCAVADGTQGIGVFQIVPEGCVHQFPEE